MQIFLGENYFHYHNDIAFAIVDLRTVVNEYRKRIEEVESIFRTTEIEKVDYIFDDIGFIPHKEMRGLDLYFIFEDLRDHCDHLVTKCDVVEEEYIEEACYGGPTSMSFHRNRIGSPIVSFEEYDYKGNGVIHRTKTIDLAAVESIIENGLKDAMIDRRFISCKCGKERFKMISDQDSRLMYIGAFYEDGTLHSADIAYIGDSDEVLENGAIYCCGCGNKYEVK